MCMGFICFRMHPLSEAAMLRAMRDSVEESVPTRVGWHLTRWGTILQSDKYSELGNNLWLSCHYSKNKVFRTKR